MSMIHIENEEKIGVKYILLQNILGQLRKILNPGDSPYQTIEVGSDPKTVAQICVYSGDHHIGHPLDVLPIHSVARSAADM